ncbi:MAG: hypothetical protein IK099_10340 [Clostridia bacterium]|nr:hypothetical protein [Clostridia bacterium]
MNDTKKAELQELLNRADGETLRITLNMTRHLLGEELPQEQRDELRAECNRLGLDTSSYRL